MVLKSIQALGPRAAGYSDTRSQEERMYQPKRGWLLLFDDHHHSIKQSTITIMMLHLLDLLDVLHSSFFRGEIELSKGFIGHRSGVASTRKRVILASLCLPQACLRARAARLVLLLFGAGVANTFFYGGPRQPCLDMPRQCGAAQSYRRHCVWAQIVLGRSRIASTTALVGMCEGAVISCGSLSTS